LEAPLAARSSLIVGFPVGMVIPPMVVGLSKPHSLARSPHSFPATQTQPIYLFNMNPYTPQSSSPRPPRNLVYTLAFDGPGSGGYRFLGKMLASSLLRTYFTGDILVFRNSPQPMFLVERKGMEEIYVDTPQIGGQAGAEDAWGWKYKVARMIDTNGYDKVLFLDADCLALRNIDHLLEGDWDIRYQPERGRKANGSTFNGYFTNEEIGTATEREGINSGTFAVRAELFHEVMAAWAAIDTKLMVRGSRCRDQASWNALMMRRGRGVNAAGSDDDQEKPSSSERASSPRWQIEPFPAGEIQFPMHLDPQFLQYRKAALTHNLAPDSHLKIEFTFGLYMRTFYSDPSGLFFSLLEM
jgi:hypothetical protein